MKKYLLFFIACVCMSFSCAPKESDTHHLKVKVTNNADLAIYVTSDYYPIGSIGQEYPWNPNDNKFGGIAQPEYRVTPGETNTTAIATIRPSNSIEGLMNGRNMKVFFIDANMYDQIPIGSPIPNDALLESRVYDLEDLQAINFHIVYP